jgi:hypothetical protein
MLGLPLAGLEIKQLELDRQILACLRDEGVHARDKSGCDSLGVGRVTFPLRLHVSAIAHQPRHT